MIVDYVKISELHDRGVPVPPYLLAFAAHCRELVDLAKERGLSEEEAKIAFHSAANEGGSLETIFELARGRMAVMA